MAYYLFNFSRKGATRGRTLREQASELLLARMWGIGSKTPNRLSLAADDSVLIYVGAPEYQFIGHAELGSSTHEWTPEEARRYPGDLEGGVVLTGANAWPHPVPIKAILPRLLLSKTNPKAQFFSGVVRITREDYETVVGAGTGKQSRSVEDADVPRQLRARPKTSYKLEAIDLDLLFKTVEKLGAAEKLDGRLSEYDTRAEFIDKYLEALGYAELGDIQRGSPVDSGDFPDYVLRISGEAAIAIEAKRLGAKLGAKEAAQVVAYCANLGVQWGVVTDGRFIHLYNAPLLGVPPVERRVLSIDLADYQDRSDFEARVYPDLELIAKKELESGAGLARRVALLAVRELLTSTSSKALRTIRRELDETKGLKLSLVELADLMSELLA